MRIAYIAGYQGPNLIKKRSIVKNRALAGSQKIAMVAKALLKRKNNVSIYSHGINAASNLKYSSSFSEELTFDKNINITYASSFSCKILNVIIATLSLIHIFKKNNNKKRFDLIIIYNLSLPEVSVACFAMLLYKIPVVLEYEDSAFVSRAGKLDVKSFLRKSYLSFIISKLTGCFAPSPELLNEINSDNRYLLRGIIDEDFIDLIKVNKIKKGNIVVYAGSHSKSKGLDLLLNGWVKNKILDWKLYILGSGSMTKELMKKYASYSDIEFMGYVPNKELYSILLKARICINPHRDISSKGNVFPFKLIEYIASGSHVISSKMGFFEEELENAITYFPTLKPMEINNTIKEVIKSDFKSNIENSNYVVNNYCLETVSYNLNELIKTSVGKI